MIMMSPNIKKQNGIALVVSLIMLLLMTLLAVSSMRTTILEEKMAGNFKDRNSAFQASESALRAGENYLRTTMVLPTFDGSTAGLYQPTTLGTISRWDQVNWSNAGEVVAYVGLPGVATQPNYIIEELQPIAELGGSLEVGAALENRFYRVTAQGVGATANAVVQLQSTYKR